MYKHTNRIKWLLTASLITLIGNSNAQESVSSYEQSIDKKNTPDNPVISEVLSSTSANYDMEALAKELNARGWEIEHKADGSLILVPRKSSDKPAEKKASTNDQWLQLQQEFKNAGWSAELDADGAMNLTPPSPAPSSRSETVNHTSKNSENNSFEGMQQKLKESGWDVSTNSDGSILLYPPKQATTKKIRSCPGIEPTVKVSLPVDNWQEAHDIAQGWLSSESIPNTAVGKIRKIFNVYIISIVSDATPFSLMHQIAVRNSDGAVIVLN